MDPQTVIVWIIGIIAAGVIIRRIFGIFAGRKRTGCFGCNDTECPLRKDSKDRQRCAALPKRKNAGNDTLQTHPKKRRKNRMSDF